MKQPDKIWGLATASLNPMSLSALRLRYCLSDLEGVKGKVLEVGCGAGMFAKAVKRYRLDLKVYGCDINKDAIEKVKLNPEGVSFLAGNAYKLPFKNKSFDAVISFDVLEHLGKPEEALKEINRILKKGGISHLFVPIEGDFYTIQGFFKKLGYIPKIKYAGHIQQYTLKEVYRLLKKAGFKIRRIHFSSHYFMQTVDMIYFIFVDIFHKNLNTTIEGYIESSDNSRKIFKKILNLVKSSISVISFYESSILKNLPSHGAHFSLQKVR